MLNCPSKPTFPRKINDYINVEYVNRALLLHKSLSDQMKPHLQETAQLVKPERILCEKSIASTGLDSQPFSQMYKAFELSFYIVESVQFGNLTGF